MARDPLPPVRITEGVQPAANIYDTYVRPETPAPSNLHAVASALAPLSPALFALAGQQVAEQEKADKAAGEAAYWEQNADGDAEGVASGAIPADRSPAFMRGYAGMAAFRDAASIQQTIGPDYEKLDKTSTDPQAFDKWFFPYVASKANPGLKTNRAYAHVWASQVAQLHGSMSARFVKDRSDALKAGAFQSFTGSLGNTVDEHYYGEGGSPNTIKLGETLNDIRVLAYKSGMDKATADKAVIDVLATKALETKNPALLDALDTMPANVQDPGGIKLGQTEYGNATKLKLQEQIRTRLLQERERAQKETDRQDKLQANTSLASVLTKWSKDTGYIPTEAEIAVISKVHPEFRSTMGRLRDAILHNDVVENPREQATLYEDIFRTGDPQGQIARAIDRGTLKTAKSIEEAVKFGNLIENYTKSGGAFKITEDPSFKSLEGAIKSHTKDPALLGSMFEESGLTDAGRAALHDARISAMRWALENRNASPMERAEFLYKLQESILKRIQQPEAMPNLGNEFKPQYTPLPQQQGQPASPAQQAPVAPAPQQTQPAQPQPAAPGNAPAATPGQQGGLPAITSPQEAAKAIGLLPAAPRVEDLANMGVPQEVIERFNAVAKAKNWTPQQLIEEVWKRAKSLGKQSSLGGGNGVEFDLPGGGRVHLTGVSPETVTQIGDMVRQMAFAETPPANPLANLGEINSQGEASMGDSTVSPRRVAQIDASPVKATVEKVAKELGFDANELKAIVSIESSGRPNVSTGSYHGLLQLSQAEFARYGDGGNIMDPEANLRAGVRSMQDKSARFAAEFGRKPSITELYLMHQQGEGGLRSHVRNLNGLAWESMASTGEGRRRGNGWAKQAVWGNVPSDMRRLFGSVANLSSAEFIAVWRHKLEGIPYRQALAEVKATDRTANA